ncbi:chloride channel protein [Mucilaginibacter myungsuensis]|uniref:Chloride channel protein n=1 Tax=Mucilaginibacter myungsuensis TaxID=649104 RepID=A0A929L5E6_9SPHI|nr:chloride channel protein [Mucilaginibacter myungsuensis]MBE9664320.1 chloride channel protein [Mucilaginibacter myungsuensis]MDN3597029.1 chloride channel protein [Mucilaginibacter myungsuensis]
MTEYSKLKRFHSYKFQKEFRANSLRKVRSYEIVLHWLHKYLNRTQFLILSGILVGLSAGLAGVILKMLVHYIHYLITAKFQFEEQIFFYIVFPLAGIVLATIAAMTFNKKGSELKGVPAILYDIAQNSSFVAPVKMYSQIIQSAITVGLGGSAGLESPIAVTGSAIGSNFSKTYNLDYKDRTLLLAAGATAGIASAFNAPIAGMMFAFEILLTGVVFTDFIPLAVAAVCGSLVSRIILNEEILFQFHSRHAFNYKNIGFYILLGLITGLYARYFTVISYRVELFFKHLSLNKLQKAVLGGSLLALLCVLFPPLFGEGYQTIKDLADGKVNNTISASFLKYFDYQEWFVLLFLGLICLFKVFATSITIFSGGTGGNFAPSLFAGGTVGYFLAILLMQLGFTNVPVTNMVLVGMAGVMSGVMYAPLTAIFLIAESSFGYDLFIPLMTVSVISYLIAKWFAPVSLDLKHLADEGQIFTKEHDQNLLTLLHTSELIDKDIQSVHIDAPFTTLIDLIRVGKRNHLAVVDNEENLVGMIRLDDVRPYLFAKDLYESLAIRNVMIQAPATINIEDDMRQIISKFDETNTWNLPVVQSGKFIGFISRSTVLNQYRELLKEHSA